MPLSTRTPVQQTPGRSTTSTPLRVPLTCRLLRNVSCTPNIELGVSHAWLPVTHTRVGSSVGLWFYYVRCVPPSLLALRLRLLCGMHSELRVNRHSPLSIKVYTPLPLLCKQARGCSDLAWDVGRTLIARNRAHLTLLLTARLLRADDPGAYDAKYYFDADTADGTGDGTGDGGWKHETVVEP